MRIIVFKFVNLSGFKLNINFQQKIYKLFSFIKSLTLLEVKYKMTPMGKNNMEHIKNKLITNFGVKIGFHAL